MSIEDIKKVSQAEEQSRLKKAEALAEADRVLAEARKAGSELIEAARQKGADEAAKLMSGAEAAAEEEIALIGKKTGSKKELLREKASERMEKAAAFIAERMVGG